VPWMSFTLSATGRPWPSNTPSSALTPLTEPPRTVNGVWNEDVGDVLPVAIPLTRMFRATSETPRR
jgi:hypothetical protein